MQAGASNAAGGAVAKVENPGKSGKRISDWIKSIGELQKVTLKPVCAMSVVQAVCRVYDMSFLQAVCRDVYHVICASGLQRCVQWQLC